MVAPSDNYDTLPEVTFDDLTLEEKVFLLSGSGFNDTAGVARLGLPGTRVCDAATDVRGSQIWNAPASAVFPNATALAATWDTNLIRAIGREVAEEGKVKNIDVLLAPTVNLHRDPRAGRNQECYGEHTRNDEFEFETASPS
jgi:beta-glucosidase